VAGEQDFTPDEWMTMQRATIAAGVLVSLSEGGGDTDEAFALQQTLRGARHTNANQLVRELATTRYSTGLSRPDTKAAEYEGPALDAIRAATAAVSRKAPADLPAFREFVVEMAQAAAEAHKEGGVRVSPREQAAIDKVRAALGLA
jgi:hypothetical protein